MRKFICLLFLLSIGTSFFGQSLKLDWVIGLRDTANYSGGVGQGLQIQSFVIDNLGNRYSFGWAKQAAVDFDPGVGTAYISNYNSFLQKLDSNGNFIWVKEIPATINYYIKHTISIDSSNNLYLSSNFNGTQDFNPGVGVFNLTSFGSDDFFVLKLDQNGNFLWGNNVGTNNWDRFKGHTIDKSGNSLLCGAFLDSIDIDPGIGTHKLFGNGNQQDVFVQKLDSSGNFLWGFQLGSIGQEDVFSITSDLNSNIYTLGEFRDTIDFDPGIGTHIVSPSSSIDFFIHKVDQNGNFLWVKTLPVNVTQIKTDNLGNAYILGYYTGTVDFDPGPNTHIINSISNNEMYLLKLDSNGNFISVLTGHSGSGVYFTLDPLNNIYLSVGRSVDKCALIKFDSNNNKIFESQFGTNNSGYGTKIYHIIVDDTNEINIAGSFTDIVDFDPTSGIYNLNGRSNFTKWVNAAFIGKYSPCSNSSDSIIVNSCGPYTAPSGAIYTNDGIYTDIIPNFSGCDSIIKINYNNQTTLSFMTANSCSTYTVPSGNNTYTMTGSYTVYDTLTNIYGCDSILNIYLSLNDQHFSTNGPICDSILNPSMTAWITTNGVYYDTLINIHGCRVYFVDTIQVYQTAYGTNTMSGCESVKSLSNNQTWTNSGMYQDTITTVGPGYCDSILTTTVTILRNTYDTINPVACKSYLSPNNNTYTSSGIYQNIITNSLGCDSIITINLTVLQPITGGNDSLWSCIPVHSQTGNQIWYSSGIYIDTLFNAGSNGCDSIFNVIIEIPVSSIPTIQTYACDSFVSFSGNQIWYYSGTYTDTLPNIQNQYGCDSIVNVQFNKQITHGVIKKEYCGSASYTSPSGKVLTSSGTYQDTITNYLGCDSIITINLYMDIGDSYINQVGNKLHIYFPNLSPYIVNSELRNYLCDHNVWNSWWPVNSGQDVLYLAVSAPYAFETRVTLNSMVYCYNNILCEPYYMVGINEDNVKNGIDFYPNPTKNITTIKLLEKKSDVFYVLNDITGRTIFQNKISNTEQFDINLGELNNGIYLLYLTLDNQTSVLKIVKE